MNGISTLVACAIHKFLHARKIRSVLDHFTAITNGLSEHQGRKELHTPVRQLRRYLSSLGKETRVNEGSMASVHIGSIVHEVRRGCPCYRGKERKDLRS
jgi:hypothetical protein